MAGDGDGVGIGAVATHISAFGDGVGIGAGAAHISAFGDSVGIGAVAVHISAFGSSGLPSSSFSFINLRFCGGVGVGGCAEAAHLVGVLAMYAGTDAHFMMGA